MNARTGSALVIVGIVLGCGVATMIPEMVAQAAAPAGGGWTCAMAEKFGESDQGVSSAKRYSDGMNRLAPEAPKGTTIVIPHAMNGNQVSAVCTKK